MVDWTAFNGFDWTIVVVVAASILLSLIRGFTREALSLAGWVAAFVLANLYAVPLTSLLAPWIDNLTGRYVVAFAMLFVGTLLLTTLLVRLSTRVVRVTGLSLLDPATEWITVVGETGLRADQRHFFRNEIGASGPFTHVKLSIWPDGGVSRLRVWGRPAESA